MRYECDDGNAPLDIEADGPDAAAQEYVDGGEWGEGRSTVYITVYVTPYDDDDELLEDEREICTVACHPDEPECPEHDGHAWGAPHEVLGGLEETPGVWAHGGGAWGVHVCLLCGLRREWDSWSHDPATGEQGLYSVAYPEEGEEAIECHVVDGDRAAVTWDGRARLVEIDDGDNSSWSIADEGEVIADWTAFDGEWSAR